MNFIFVGPCIVNQIQHLSNKMRLYSVSYISVGSSTCFGCWHQTSGARTTVITASGTGQPGLPPALVVEFLLNNESGWLNSPNRSCNYNCSSSWWWVSTPETCRAAYRNVIHWIQSHLIGQLLNYTHECLYLYMAVVTVCTACITLSNNTYVPHKGRSSPSQKKATFPEQSLTFWRRNCFFFNFSTPCI